LDGQPQDLIDSRATLRFGSHGFVYTEPAESVAGRTFARPPRTNALTGVAGHEAFVRGFSDEIIIGMLGPNPTQERFRLVAYYLTDLAFQASGDEPLAWGQFMEWYITFYPPWTTRPPRQPGDGLRQQLPCDRRRPWVYDDSEGTDHTTARPHAGVQRSRGLCIEQLRTGVGSAPPRRLRQPAGATR
jgi:hypothetical protein